MAKRASSTQTAPREPSAPKKAPRKSAAKPTGAKPATKAGGGRTSGRPRRTASTGFTSGSAKGRHLVIVESPAKAKTINKYLGTDYLVLASVGHVRDLPSKAKKGEKTPVPGVDLQENFAPTYEVLSGKDKVITELKRAAKETRDSGREVWFATDLDREGEAIAWHLAQELGIASEQAKRVVFAAITKSEIERAFHHPHPIDEDKVNAQQARRVLDRIVGYQVSPLLWKKVARGLSAGRVQSVAVRVVVEREREIRAFVPEEFWSLEACLTPELAKAQGFAKSWAELLASRDDRGKGPTLKDQNAWLAGHSSLRAELVEFRGQRADLRQREGFTFDRADACDLTPRVREILEAIGARNVRSRLTEEQAGRGPARWRRTIQCDVDSGARFAVSSIDTKRTSSRPQAPFITSTLQQAASSRLGFGAQRTMRAAQQLYEGVDIPGEGPVGLITYMRTDSTHLSREAVDMARDYILKEFGPKYLPSSPSVYTSSNKAAQEAHEAIRPTSLQYPPQRVQRALSSDQLRLYTVIWERFVACQMTNAQWDSTTVEIEAGPEQSPIAKLRASGRVLAFDGFYRVAGVPTASDTATLPPLRANQALAPFDLDAQQRFTSPPARYSEASLIKMLESEGIGRPSTYASIIQVIQDRKYVEQLERRFYATDLGEVVTDKLIEAFPNIMEVGYTRDLEGKLDKIEEEHTDWIQTLHDFYGPFQESLELAHENLTHAKAETQPAPKEYRCADCGADMVYRFGKSGRFLSCSRYPDCKYASPCDREGRPQPIETVDVACPLCGGAMTRRTGRFGPFLGCARYGDKVNPCTGILNIDKKGHVVAPSPPPYVTDLPCPTCEAPLNLRSGLRGPWLGCSRFPKCRGRGKWAELDDATREALEKALAQHDRENPVPIIRTMGGKPLTDAKGKPLPDAPSVDALVSDRDESDAGEERQAG
ncbi:MAG: type I DNA topoisomerase [Phycisphaeraceae bacterium]|nr:type I DNA topoisomerase [Phycisphaeraceae bacterium]